MSRNLSYPLVILMSMELNVLDDAADLVEKANRDLEPALVSAADVRTLLERYARIEKLASYGRTVLAAKIDDPSKVARASGTSIGKAKSTVETAKALRDADEVRSAFAGGAISLDQASEIAKAEQASPGCAAELVSVAQDESFNVLRDKARKIKLEAEQSKDLFARQHAARSARSFTDDLGMVDIHLRFQPHVGTPIVNRAEADADRLYRKAKKEGAPEQFERCLADAYAEMLSGNGKGRTTRPELVVLVSHEVTQRSWTDVRDGEVCKIPGVGPVTPGVAKTIADDAFLTGVFFDGKDLRNIKRWTRNIPVEVRLALELGEPPDFDGVRCVDCGNRFRNENDHVEPRNRGGPTSTGNIKHRCWPCHQAKTARDRKAGKLTPPPPGEDRAPP